MNINNEFVADRDFSICDYAFEAVEGIRYTVDISVNNVIGSGNKIVTSFGKFVVLSNKTDIIIQNVFFSQFLYGLQITHLTETSPVIQYTTPNCGIQNDFMVKLWVNYSNNYFESIQSYESRMLILNDLKLNNILMCTLNVFYISPEDQSAVIFIGMSHTN